MASFQCVVCGASFQVPQSVIDRYRGWEPKYCREHSPQKRGSALVTGQPTGHASRRGSLREENLTAEQVLSKYSGGPDSGVFTDGSASPNPGPGGWGVVWVMDGTIQSETHGHDPATTNNRMELRALIEAFKLLPADAETRVFTDSRLCVNTITQWAPGWEKKGWKKKTGPIKNLDMVKELLALYRVHASCELMWVAAHSGNRWNEYADSLATAWMRNRL